jgi:hypothetical protein
MDGREGTKKKKKCVESFWFGLLGVLKGERRWRRIK